MGVFRKYKHLTILMVGSTNNSGSNGLILKSRSISPAGFRLLIDETEYYVSFEDYPRFKQAKLFEIFNMQRLSPDQFHWPDLDIDIELDALKMPEKYPLAWKDEK